MARKVSKDKKLRKPDAAKAAAKAKKPAPPSKSAKATKAPAPKAPAPKDAAKKDAGKKDVALKDGKAKAVVKDGAKPADPKGKAKAVPAAKAAKPAAVKEPKAPKEPPVKKKRKGASVVRYKAFWGVFNQMLKRVALFEYAEKKAADKKAADLSVSSKQPHFVQVVKEVIRDEEEA